MVVAVDRVRPPSLPPTKHAKYYESSGLERSLATAVMDNPMTINVNTLRTSRGENNVDGIGSYDTRVLTGNWAEERSDKAYKPSAAKAPKMGNPTMYRTEYMRYAELATNMVFPKPGFDSFRHVPYETTSRSAYINPALRSIQQATGRCDIGKCDFQLRNPSHDTKSKMLCTIKSDEFGCDRKDEQYLKGHVLGFPVPGKQKVYTLDEYRNRWTKNAPDIKAAGVVPQSEYRHAYRDRKDQSTDSVLTRPGHTGAWH